MIRNDIYAGEQTPMSRFDPQTHPDYLKAVNTLYELISELKAHGIPNEFLMKMEAACNHVKAIETELMFCYAVKFGAMLQRELES